MSLEISFDSETFRMKFCEMDISNKYFRGLEDLRDLAFIQRLVFNRVNTVSLPIRTSMNAKLIVLIGHCLAAMRRNLLLAT